MFISEKETIEFLQNCDNIYIFTHRSPDGDCIGTGFALHDFFRRTGRRSAVLCSDNFPDKFKFITDTENDSDFTPEVFITVDVADKKLMGKYEKLYGDKINLCIDHHVSNKDYAERTFLKADDAAACQVLYGLFRTMGFELSDYSAACIYTGISTDTGCFRYENANAETHIIAGEIMSSHNLNYAEINRQMFEIKSKARMTLESNICNIMEEYLDGKLVIVAVTADMVQKWGIVSGELDGVASITVQLEGTEVGVFVKEREDGTFRCSFRSAGSVNVSEICQTFGGGGHAKAAGCTIDGNIESAKTQIIEAVRKALT
ncbi:MAG: DHH family phosphoesterase [Ruminococcus sp.]|nr:DHH family phosphoesterase [Ruminococcus sp.]MDE7225573.1 DHH family phosphoesterase [Ruminococcus sp.]